MLAVPVEAVCKEVVGIPVEVVGSMLRIPGGIFFYWSASPMHGSVDWHWACTAALWRCMQHP